MSIIIIAAVMAAGLTHTAGAPDKAGTVRIVAAGERRAAIEEASRRWLALADAGRWQDTWAQAGATFRATVTAEKWAAMAVAVRPPLGAVQSRRETDVISLVDMPRSPVKGEVVTVRYSTDFANKRGLIETVALAFEDSRWRVEGYWIAPDPAASK